ncbi:SanA protein [Leeuwenhoekiella aestuarii]|uniref:SanA protein n=1 Tax=Leeuwenhoekiella aestuarii TaxID=2249426 RepID=A0A4Q0NYA3_9FLAO|nr:SanA protein [Leeuwenhoekiella aestuarii]RXG17141.1 SanA protein [Leeuwenhoekiella aestuarii]
MFIKKILALRILRYLILAALLVLILTSYLSYHIRNETEQFIYDDINTIPKTYTALVLGASVKSNGELSTMLRDRVESALLLYHRGKVNRFLVSGDNRTTNYNEPVAMKKYLQERGVPEKDIFMDFAGFDTYDSVYRASYIFEVDNAIVVSQRFHLPRAVYIARSMGLNFYGYNGDRREYELESRNRFREVAANVKAWLELLINKEPHFKGDKIPITGKNN